MVNSLVVLLHVAILMAAAYVIWRRQTRLRTFFWPALLLRACCSIAVGLLYTYYYTAADTFQYFSDARQMAELALRSPAAWLHLMLFDEGLEQLTLGYTGPRALFLTKITSVLSLITLGNYWVTTLYFSFLSFLASWFLTTTLCRLIPAARVAALAAILFLPSAVFWTSGLLKETLAVASLYFLIAVFIQRWCGDKPLPWQYILAAVALWVLWTLKYYYAGIFLPVAITTLIYRYPERTWGPFRGLTETAVWLVLFLLPLVLISFLHPNFNFHRVLEVIVQNNHAYNALSAPEDVVAFDALAPTIPDVLRNAPWALFSGLFRPLLWESGSLPQTVAALENTVVLLLFVWTCLRMKARVPRPYRVLLLAAIVYVALLAILLTLSAPNFGTLSRYKSGYLWLFVLIILCNHPVITWMERSRRRLVSQ